MRIKTFAIIIFIVLGIAHVYGQTNKLYGYYGSNDVRVKASFGLIPDEKFNNVTPLTKIETDKILILTQFDNKVEITFKPFFPSDLPKKELTFTVSDYVDSLFKSRVSNNQIEISFIENIDKEKLSIVTNKWNGELKVKDTQSLSYIADKYQSNYMIVLIGGGFRDFLRNTQLPFQSQGLFIKGKEKFVYAGHRIGIFDLQTGKIIENGYSIQASADISETNYNKDFSSDESYDFKILEEEVKKRIDNNIEQTIKILKINN